MGWERRRGSIAALRIAVAAPGHKPLWFNRVVVTRSPKPSRGFATICHVARYLPPTHGKSIALPKQGLSCRAERVACESIDSRRTAADRHPGHWDVGMEIVAKQVLPLGVFRWFRSPVNHGPAAWWNESTSGSHQMGPPPRQEVAESIEGTGPNLPRPQREQPTAIDLAIQTQKRRDQDQVTAVTRIV